MSDETGVVAMPVDLDAIRPCLEGVIPGVMATCGADGTPNVAYLSQVEYVDSKHLALSFQFFNKTRRNVLDNAFVELLVIHPRTGVLFRIQAQLLRTETEGPLFERMKAKLAGIASHTGMSEVFKLLGADVYEVTGLQRVTTARVDEPLAGPNRLSLLRHGVAKLSACADLGSLLETTLDVLERDFGVSHAMLLMRDGAGERLYTVASRGYGDSGIGSEIPLGEGVIGTAARMRTPIRINHMTFDRAYSRATRDRLSARGDDAAIEREIPLPGIQEPRSQLALPMLAGDELLGVLFVESPREMCFSWDDEDAYAVLAAHAGMRAREFQLCAEADDEVPVVVAPGQPSSVAAAPLRVRYFDADCSVFLDDDYLIKGVAGAVLWKLLRDHANEGRTEFSNRELRLSPELRLPDMADNLEARLVLLERRLLERCKGVRIEKTGRGRFRLCLNRTLRLQPVQA
jgi:hypothetical protein